MEPSTYQCLYCDREIKFKEIHCNSQECNTLFKYKCKKILPCGHDCFLASTSTKCICLINKCFYNKSKCNINPTKTNTLTSLFKSFSDCDNDISSKYLIKDCMYCLDKIDKYPLIITDCNHLFHHKCISLLFNSNKISNGDEINLNFIKCCSCLSKLKLSNHTDFTAILNYYDGLERKIEDIIFIQIEKENIERNKEIIDKDSRYYNNPIKFCFDKFRFYLCYKCENPFYGGLKECLLPEVNVDIKDNKSTLSIDSVDVVNEDKKNDSNNIKEETCYFEEFKNVEEIRASKVCINCIDSSNIKGVLDCEIHGREHILFKCRFCCNESSHFCWGTTHFCEECHFKQLKGDLLTTKKLNELPKCDKSICFLKGNHSLNGYEFAIGCQLCLNNSDNIVKN